MGNRGLFRIRTRYLFLVLFSVLVFLASGYLVLRSISAEAELNAAQYMSGNLRSVSTIVDEVANDVEFVFTPLLGDPDFLNQTSDLGFLNPVRTYEGYLRMKKLEGIFKASYLSSRYISSISYLDIRSGLMLDASSYLHFPSAAKARFSDWYGNFEKTGVSPVWTANSLYGKDEAVLSSYRVIRGFDGAWRDLGVVSINIRLRDIADIIGRSTLGMTGSIVVLDALGKVIFDARNSGPEDLAWIAGAGRPGPGQPSVPGTLALSDGDFRAVPFVSSRTGFRFVGLLPLKSVTSFLPLVTAYIAFSYLALLIVVVFLAVTSYRSFYRPLSKLSDGMQEFSRGNFSIRIESRKEDEVALLFRAFNDMVSRLKRLIDDNYLIKLEQKDARMRMMLSQMNEHFLYNTLDCIHWLARKHGVDEIADVVFALSRFYSLSLSDGKDEIRVSEAAEVIENYLKILLVRKPEDFAYSIAVEERVRDLRVLKFLFQPLVENAFIHGVSELDKPGRIDISFRAEGECLRFDVKDNGAGMSPARLAAVTAAMEGDAAGREEAFALRSINAQIMLFYGEEYRLRIDSREGGGTEAGFALPISRLGTVHA